MTPEPPASQPPAPPPSADAPKPSPSDHYQTLEGLYDRALDTIKLIAKLGATVAAGLVLVAGFLLYKNVSDLREDITRSANTATSLAQQQVNTTLAEIRSQALAAAQDRVNQALREPNISAMIESSARRQVGRAVEGQVQRESSRIVEAAQEEMTKLAGLADYAMQMRIGRRAGLEKLYRVKKDSTEQTTRTRAATFFESVANDWEASVRQELREGGWKDADPVVALGGRVGEPFLAGERIVPRLVELVRTSRDLEELTMAFLSLSKVTGHPFQMFDLDAVDQWCKKHTSECAK